MSAMLKFEHPKQQSNIIKVIGVGGGGSNAVTHMYNQGIKGVDFILCNTDSQALETSPVPNKVHLGNRNLGAGNVPSVGRDAAIETKDQLNDILSPHTKMLFITAGMGGGTGTGAAPVVAELARELDILTVGIVTLPFAFEGRRRRQQALEGIDELRKNVDALLIISNDKLRDEYGNMKLTEAFKKADDVLTTAAKGIAEIITVTGYINVDFEDVKTVMKQSGKAIMGAGRAEGENRATKAIEDAMRSPLLNDSNIAGAKNILLYITSGLEEVTFDEVKDITDYIQTVCGNTAEVIWGNGIDHSLENQIAITVIATGFASDEEFMKVNPLYGDRASSLYTGVKPVTIHSLAEEAKEVKAVDEGVSRQRPAEPYTLQPGVKPVKIHSLFEPEKAEVPVEEPVNEIIDEFIPADAEVQETAEEEVDDVVFEIKQHDREIIFEINPVKEPLRETVHQLETSQSSRAEMDRKAEERRARLNSISLKFKTNDGIEELERQPAYERKGLNMTDERDASSDVSRYTINDQRPGLRSENSYLHDNVD